MYILGGNIKQERVIGIEGSEYRRVKNKRERVAVGKCIRIFFSKN